MDVTSCYALTGFLVLVIHTTLTILETEVCCSAMELTMEAVPH